MVIPTKKLKCGFEMPVYGLGTWQMGGRFERSQLFLVSKVSSKHLRYDDLIVAARASLKRLGTNYLDLFVKNGER